MVNSAQCTKPRSRPKMLRRLTDTKAQTIEESLRRVTAIANTTNDGQFQGSFVWLPKGAYAQTNRSQQGRFSKYAAESP